MAFKSSSKVHPAHEKDVQRVFVFAAGGNGIGIDIDADSDPDTDSGISRPRFYFRTKYQPRAAPLISRSKAPEYEEPEVRSQK